MKAKQYYDLSKHKDDWDVDVVYPTTVVNIIELARLEGFLQGLSAAKEEAKRRELASISEELENRELTAKKRLEEKFNLLT